MLHRSTVIRRVLRNFMLAVATSTFLSGCYTTRGYAPNGGPPSDLGAGTVAIWSDGCVELQGFIQKRMLRDESVALADRGARLMRRHLRAYGIQTRAKRLASVCLLDQYGFHRPFSSRDGQPLQQQRGMPLPREGVNLGEEDHAIVNAILTLDCQAFERENNAKVWIDRAGTPERCAKAASGSDHLAVLQRTFGPARHLLIGNHLEFKETTGEKIFGSFSNGGAEPKDNYRLFDLQTGRLLWRRANKRPSAMRTVLARPVRRNAPQPEFVVDALRVSLADLMCAQR